MVLQMKSMEKTLLLKTLGNSPELRVIDFFLDNKAFDFSKKEIIEEVGMSKTTFYNIWDRIEEAGIVKINRKFGKAKLYKLNIDNPIVEMLIKIDQKLMMEARKNTRIPVKVRS